MRVIAGQYRGRLLKSPGGSKTRPTSDRLRETLFNILNPHITPETRFLDLFAGTGAVGIEAISRGAGLAAFVDKSRRSCGLIEENLDLLDISEQQTEVFCKTAESFTSGSRTSGWDIIFLDPPYKSDYFPVLNAIGRAELNLLLPTGILIVEHHAKNILPEVVGDLRRWRIVKQGGTHLSFFEKV